MKGMFISKNEYLIDNNFVSESRETTNSNPLERMVNPYENAMSKSEVVLIIFYRLYTQKTIRKSEILCDCGINSLTFARYLADIRCFLLEANLPFEILYNKTNDCYSLNNITFPD